MSDITATTKTYKLAQASLIKTANLGNLGQIWSDLTPEVRNSLIGLLGGGVLGGALGGASGKGFFGPAIGGALLGGVGGYLIPHLLGGNAPAPQTNTVTPKKWAPMDPDRKGSSLYAPGLPGDKHPVRDWLAKAPGAAKDFAWNTGKRTLKTVTAPVTVPAGIAWGAGKKGIETIKGIGEANKGLEQAITNS